MTDGQRPYKMPRLDPEALSEKSTRRLPRFHQTMLRIRDPKISIPFYESNFGMTLVHWTTSFQAGATSYYLERQREDARSPYCSLTHTSPDCERYLWNMDGTTIELCHMHGTETDPAFGGYWSGNSGRDASGDLYAEQPLGRGFGHLAFNVKDVYKACAKLEENGVKFQKKPDEGRMKGLAFALDPDGYWIEICSRARVVRWPEYQNLSQTMLRVKDGPKSVEFYTKHLGMTLLRRSDFRRWKFSLFFLASLTEAEIDMANEEIAKARRSNSSSSSSSSTSSSSSSKKPSPSAIWNPVLELTWNHGTENDPGFCVHNGNSEPLGFGHIGFVVDGLEDLCKRMEAAGVNFTRKPGERDLHGTALASDPSGYVVELIDRKVPSLCD